MRFFSRLLDKIFDRWLAPRVQARVHHILLYEHLVFGDRSRVHIAPTAVVNNALFNVASGHIYVEDYAFFGHSVSLLTGTHDHRQIAEKRQEYPMSGRDIHIRRGAWVASNATVIGPCELGENCVVAAGAVVRADVPANAIVAGVPARIVGTIDQNSSTSAGLQNVQHE